MTDDRRQRIEQIYLDALDTPAVDRPGFLDRACGGDQSLRSEVEALLALQSGAEAFLEQPAIESAARTLADILPALRPPEIPGYKIIRHLGEGGMGLVYLAEQEAPLRRLVALKVIRPGMDSREIVARFNAERQALAQMDHPNIAAVHDAGATSDGRPFFVMEFVDGLPISEYCDRKALPTVARLGLFTQVCAGVQHAHQKGVIHRDLKPSNVLVAEHDGRPMPKVIDFGTAKAIDRSAGDAVTLTAHGMVLGTIEYMSPEQAAFSRDIDTTTDVYSLGVMLYELLVGVLPFERPRPGPEGYDELRRLIRDSDPERPSARLSAIAESRAGIASARQTDPDRLRRSVQGDLDWITLKALEKDRTRRYPTVAAFASDIQRFLLDQPVDARPPSAAYRIRKFTRRHRVAVGAVAAIIAILGAGVTAATVLYLRAERALRDATSSAYVATLAAASGDLRIGAAGEARARLVTVPEAQRGWEWRHLFVQADENAFSYTSAAPPCVEYPIRMAALNLDTDGQSILLRRCLTIERLSVATFEPFARTIWTAPPETIQIAAQNSRGQIVTLQGPLVSASPAERLVLERFRLVLTDRSGSTAPVSLGPFERFPDCAAISSDGARVGVGLGGEFEVWNVATGRREFRLGVSHGRSSTQCKIRFSPDGRYLATSHAEVHVWDAASGAKRASDPMGSSTRQLSFMPSSSPNPIAFSQDGNRLAIGRTNGLVDVMDLSQSSPTLVRLSADERVVESSLPESDLVSNFITNNLRTRGVFAVAFSPDDQTVVSGTSTTVGVWDIRQSKLVRVLSGHTGDVVDVLVSADGRRIYSVDTYHVVRAWPSRSAPAVVRTPSSSSTVSSSSAISADGIIVATAMSDGALATIRPSDLHQEVIREATVNSTGQKPPMITISNDGRRLFSLESGGLLTKWTIGPKETVPVSTSTPSSVQWLTVSPSGSLLALAYGHRVAVWDASTMKQLTEVDSFGNPVQLLFRDEEALIISTGASREALRPRVHLWNWRTNRVLAKVEPGPGVGPQNAAWRLALSPDRRLIALLSNVGGPGLASIWDGELKAEVGRLPPGDYSALAFSPDGRRIVSVGAEETAVRIWDSDKLRLLLTLSDTDSHIGGVAFNADGQIVAYRTRGGLTIWETRIRQR